jgi:hypothetical protein
MPRGLFSSLLDSAATDIRIVPSLYSILDGKSELMKRLHSSLPEQTYSQLRAEAKRSRTPASTLAREVRHEAIAAYAAAAAGTALDLDAELESGGIEHLARAGRERN